MDIEGTHENTPHPYFHRATIVKDTDGRLASLVTASGPPTAEPTREAARKVIEEAIYHIGFVTMQNVRGSHHHAMSNLCELANSVYTLLAQLRGREGYAEASWSASYAQMSSRCSTRPGPPAQSEWLSGAQRAGCGNGRAMYGRRRSSGSARS